MDPQMGPRIEMKGRMVQNTLKRAHRPIMMPKSMKMTSNMKTISNMHMTSNMKTISNMKMTSNMKTTSNMKRTL